MYSELVHMYSELVHMYSNDKLATTRDTHVQLLCSYVEHTIDQSYCSISFSYNTSLSLDVTWYITYQYLNGMVFTTWL